MTISNVIRILKEALEGDREQREMLPKLQREADRAWRRADRRIERARLGAQSAMGILEKIRINVLAVQMDEFLHEYEELKNVHLEDCSGYIDLRADPLDQKRLHTLVDMYDRIRDAGDRRLFRPFRVHHALRTGAAHLVCPDAGFPFR